MLSYMFKVLGPPSADELLAMNPELDVASAKMPEVKTNSVLEILKKHELYEAIRCCLQYNPVKRSKVFSVI